MGFLFMLVLIWATTLGGWYFLSKYVKSADVDKIKARLAGKGRSKIVKKGAKDEQQALFQTEGTPKNKFAHALVQRYELAPKIGHLLEQAGLKWPPARLVHLCLVAAMAGTAAVWLLVPVPPIFAPLGAIAGLGPIGYVMVLRSKRLRAFESVFPDVLEFISRSMRAGHAFSVSLEMIHREFQEPISSEFRRAFEEHNLGLPLEEALQKLAVRVPSMDVHFFVSAVMLQKRTGGNLAEILDKLAYVIRERFKLRGRIRAVSAHGRMTAITLSAIPLSVGALMILTNAEYSQFFFHDEIGIYLLIASGVLQLIGYAIMKKIVKIEI